MKHLMIPLAAVALGAVAAPAAAQAWQDGYTNIAYDQDDRRDDQRDDRRDYRESRQDLRKEQRDLQRAYRDGDRRDIREERRDVRQAQNQLRRDGRDWQRGRNYNYNRPDPRYNGYYADNYYRSGNNYQQRVLGVNDRVYRGRDNRYYCRRNDGTTGLIIGGIGGGVLGNVIAPGGSKTLGSIVGGGLGAILGNSIARNNVTCR